MGTEKPVEGKHSVKNKAQGDCKKIKKVDLV